MSEAVLVAGKRGSGKTLGALSMIRRYVEEGRVVATNLDIYIEHLAPSWNRVHCYRLPDFPTADDLKELPPGNPDPVQEGNNGLLVLDEAATFLNSREWKGESRQDLISWLVQSRKYGWDLLLIAQHVNLIDKQVREALIEIQGTVRRMDKIQVPFFSSIWKYFTARPLHFPKIHYVALRYGFLPSAPIADRWFWRGGDLYKAYDTLQRISRVTGQQGTSVMLSAWDMKGRHMEKWDLRRQMAAGGLVMGMLVGFAGGFGVAWHRFRARLEVPATTVASAVPRAPEPKETAKVRGVVGSKTVYLVLTDGRVVQSDGFRLDGSMGVGKQYRSGGRWYELVE
jgi:hypothetical protein